MRGCRHYVRKLGKKRYERKTEYIIVKPEQKTGFFCPGKGFVVVFALIFPLIRSSSMARPGPETQARRHREQVKKEKRRAKEAKRVLRKEQKITNAE